MIERERYYDLVRDHPELFANPAGAAITIVLDPAEIATIEAEMAERLRARGMPAEWAQVGIAYEDQYLMLLRDAVRFPDGSPGTYIRAVNPYGDVPGVVVLPVYRGGVIMVRHFRHAMRSWHLELPRGFGAPGATAEENARRELAEEIGATPTRLIALGRVYPDTGAGADRAELFYAEIEGYGDPEVEEGISDLVTLSPSEFERLIREGEISDGYTLAAYARAKAARIL